MSHKRKVRQGGEGGYMQAIPPPAVCPPGDIWEVGVVPPERMGVLSTGIPAWLGNTPRHRAKSHGIGFCGNSWVPKDEKQGWGSIC